MLASLRRMSARCRNRAHELACSAKSTLQAVVGCRTAHQAPARAITLPKLANWVGTGPCHAGRGPETVLLASKLNQLPSVAILATVFPWVTRYPSVT